MIRAGQITEALSFASTELAPRGSQHPEFLGDLEKTMALLAFPELAAIGSTHASSTSTPVAVDAAAGIETIDKTTGEPVAASAQPAWATLGSLLKAEHRTQVAKMLNAAILDSQGQGQETRLSGLVKLMSWGEGKLKNKGIHVPGIQVGTLLGQDGSDGRTESKSDEPMPL